ncbi:hypothetical protein NKH52_29525 [Mesorhizobium sp. M1066]|uniref:hypothetical protein n=1 Tax=unclassified Mesorhizobium TaxID=325217 RepID=UPI0033356754
MHDLIAFIGDNAELVITHRQPSPHLLCCSEAVDLPLGASPIWKAELPDEVTKSLR